MKFNFFYGLKLMKHRAVDFSGKSYECKLLLQGKNGQPVAVSRNTELGIWKVDCNFSSVYFGTYEEALAYCKGRFFDTDGKAM